MTTYTYYAVFQLPDSDIGGYIVSDERTFDSMEDLFLFCTENPEYEARRIVRGINVTQQYYDFDAQKWVTFGQ